MSELLTPDILKASLEITHDEDDALIEILADIAEGRFQADSGSMIAKTAYTEFHDGNSSVLVLRRKPIDPDLTKFVVVDTKGTMDPADEETLVGTESYRLDHEAGLLYRTTSHGRTRWWETGQRRWRITYNAGLELHEDWENGIKEDLLGALMQLGDHLYENRDPTLTSEGSGLAMRRMQKLALPIEVAAVFQRYSPII